MMLGSIGPFELIVILLIALIIFGPKNLPEVGKSLGKAIVGFKRSLKDISNDINEEDKKVDR